MYLRPYRKGDVDGLYALDVLCFAEPFRFSKRTMRAVVEQDGAIVQLACERDAEGEEVLLGFGAVQREAEGAAFVGYVATLDVAPGQRGRGLGRALMLALEDGARLAGVGWMILHVHVENAAAMRLYGALGYEREVFEEDFYQTGLHAWRYRKAL